MVSQPFSISRVSDVGHPTSRKDAKQIGAKYYVPSAKCVHGHDPLRYTSTGDCVECRKNRSRAAYKDPEVARRKLRQAERWGIENPEAKRAHQKVYRNSNLGKISRHRGKTRRRLRLRDATPKWLNKEQLAALNRIYEHCAQVSKETGVPHHVDHIVPLLGRGVSGLHVPWNLQILPARYNVSKGAAHED